MNSLFDIFENDFGQNHEKFRPKMGSPFPLRISKNRCFYFLEFSVGQK